MNPCIIGSADNVAKYAIYGGARSIQAKNSENETNSGSIAPKIAAILDFMPRSIIKPDNR